MTVKLNLEDHVRVFQHDSLRLRALFSGENTAGLSDEFKTRRCEVVIKSEGDFDMSLPHQDKTRRIHGRELMKFLPSEILPGCAHLVCATGDDFKVRQFFQ